MINTNKGYPLFAEFGVGNSLNSQNHKFTKSQSCFYMIMNMTLMTTMKSKTTTMTMTSSPLSRTTVLSSRCCSHNKGRQRFIICFLFYPSTISLARARARSMWLQMFSSPMMRWKLLRLRTVSTFSLTPERTTVIPSF